MKTHLRLQASGHGRHLCGSGSRARARQRKKHGQLGLGDLKPRSTPARVDVPASTAIGTGRFQSCVILETGGLSCWWGGIDFEGDVDGAAVALPRAIGEPTDRKAHV